MCKYTRSFSFIIMISLIILEIFTFTLSFMVLLKTFELNDHTTIEKELYFINILDTTMSMTLNMFSIWIILVFVFIRFTLKLLEDFYGTQFAPYSYPAVFGYFSYLISFTTT